MSKDQSGIQKRKVGKVTLQEFFFFPRAKKRQTLSRDGRTERVGGWGSRGCQGRPPDEYFRLSLRPQNITT